MLSTCFFLSFIPAWFLESRGNFDSTWGVSVAYLQYPPTLPPHVKNLQNYETNSDWKLGDCFVTNKNVTFSLGFKTSKKNLFFVGIFKKNRQK